MSLPRMLIVSEEQMALDSYRRLFHSYASVEGVVGFSDGMEILKHEEHACAVVMTCCDSLGPKDRDLLRQAQMSQPHASRIVLVDSRCQHSEDPESVYAIQYERKKGDTKALQEVLLSAIMEHRIASLASNLRQ